METTDAQTTDSRDELAWSVRLSTNKPAKVAVVLVFALLAFVVGIAIFRNLPLGVAGMAIVLGATMEFLLGSHYKVDAKGATSRVGMSVSSMEWASVKRVVEGSQGIHLSPFERTSARDAFRGVFLRYGAENRDAVLRAVRRYLPDNAGHDE